MIRKTTSLIIAACIAFATAGHCTTADEFVTQGRNYLEASQRNINAANLCFSNAVAKAPNNANANVFRAITRVLALPNQTAGSNFLNTIGISKQGRNLFNWTAKIATTSDGSTKVPSMKASEATDLLRNNILPDWLGAETNLAKITDTNFTLTLTAEETGSSAVTLDYGDIQLFRAGLKVGALFIYTTHAWNLDAQIADIIKVATNSGLKGIADSYPKLLTYATTADLATAKAAFQSAVSLYLTGSQFIRNRTAVDNQLFNWDASMSSSEEKFRLTLIDLTNSLAGPVTLSQNQNCSVNAAQFFNATNTIRSFLPSFGRKEFILGSLPDSTFGGIVSGLTRSEVEKTVASKLSPLLRAPGVTLSSVLSFTESVSYSWDRSITPTLIQTSDQSWYIASPHGGPLGDYYSGSGAIYKVSSSGAFSTVTTFTNDADGNFPNGRYPNTLVDGKDGYLYGTTASGGDNGSSTFFKIAPVKKKLTVLASFSGSPSSLIKGNDGNFYGFEGNSFFQATTNGEIYEGIGSIDVSGYSGYQTYSPLILGKDGNFYGTFANPNSSDNTGQAFGISPDGTVFLNSTIDGTPCGPLAQDSNGDFYGISGWQYWDDMSYTMLYSGFMLFKLTTNGEVTYYSLTGDLVTGGRFQAQAPVGITLDGKGNILGVTTEGGGSGKGVIFKASISESESAIAVPLVWFEKIKTAPTGTYPSTPLVKGVDGSFYGLASDDGAYGNGSLYKLSLTGVPTISQQPTGFTDAKGSDYNYLYVSAVGDSPLQYQWLKNNVRVLGETNQSFYFTNLVAENVGKYQVIVQNANGKVTSDVAVVTVLLPPAISQLVTNQLARIGGSAMLSVTATGVGAFSYQWLHNGKYIDPYGIITTIAGNDQSDYLGDGQQATNASLSYPYGVAVDASNNLYIADSYNSCVRKVDSSGIITTVVGIGQSWNYSGDGQQATNATLGDPRGVAVDASGNLYIADSGNSCVRKVDRLGIITTIAGNGQSDYLGDGQQATNASLNNPYGVAVDASGNLYIADSGNNCVRKVNSLGIITTVAGIGQSAGYSGDGQQATNATLGNPLGVAVDALGNLYIADSGYSCVRKVDSSGIITTVVGSGQWGYSGDGEQATNAVLKSPQDIAVDASGNLYIADPDNSCVRKVDSSGIITTVAGIGQSAGYSGDGEQATNASLNYPCGVAVDASGNLYIADTDNNRVRKVNLNVSVQNGMLNLGSVSITDLGSYQVVVTSPYGSTTSSSITLATAQPPVIQTQPVSQTTLAVSNTVTFTVSASGTAPMAFQWRKNGLALTNNSRISGVKSNSLTIKSLATNDSGIYTLRITNSVDSVVSFNANLTVFVPDTQPPTLTVTSPESGIRNTNDTPVLIVTGKATDNVAVSNVIGKLIAHGSTNAITVTPNPNWSNWTATVTLTPGTNKMAFYAVDTTNNVSTVTNVSVIYMQAARLALQFTNGTVKSYTNGQLLLVGSNYTLTATPAKGYVFSNWSGSVTATTNVLKFQMQTDTHLVATFIPNPFPAVAGHYEGLFTNAISITLTNSGAFKADITTNGAYTARLIQGAKTYTYSGPLSVGKTAFTPVSTKQPSLSLQWDATEVGKLTGTVASNTWSSDLAAYRTPFSASAPTPLAGKYTLAIAGGEPPQPAGYGTLSITVSNNGGILVGGYAADGGTVSEGTALSEHGYWPLYSTVSNGVLFGWQTLLSGSTNLTGWAYWLKPTNSALHLPGIAYNTTNLVGSTYTNKKAILNLTNGLLVFSGGDLVDNLTNRFSITNNIATIITKTNGLKLTFFTNSGLFSGSITNPTTKKQASFSGAVLQQQNEGAGAFQSTNQSGAVRLISAP